MDGSAVAGLESVVAPLNFLVPMAEKPVAYNYEPPPGTPQRTGRNEEHRVTIRDARPLIGELASSRSSGNHWCVIRLLTMASSGSGLVIEGIG